MKFEELEILHSAEVIADSIWREVGQWEPFASDVVGRQFARAADSIGANIAEAFGRYHYGEKLQFLYYARGSLYETKYWLNRAVVRELLSVNLGNSFTRDLTQLARQLNASLSSLRDLRSEDKSRKRNISEIENDYILDSDDNHTLLLFSESDLEYLFELPSSTTE